MSIIRDNVLTVFLFKIHEALYILRVLYLGLHSSRKLSFSKSSQLTSGFFSSKIFQVHTTAIHCGLDSSSIRHSISLSVQKVFRLNLQWSV